MEMSRSAGKANLLKRVVYTVSDDWTSARSDSKKLRLCALETGIKIQSTTISQGPQIKATQQKDVDPLRPHITRSPERAVSSNGLHRDKSAWEDQTLCVDMEAAGLMNHFPSLVILRRILWRLEYTRGGRLALLHYRKRSTMV
jgi:hypothetical protein